MKKHILFLLLTLATLSRAQSIKDLQENLISVNFSYPFIDINYCSFDNFIINKDTKLENEYLDNLKNEYAKLNFFNQENKQTYIKVKSQLSFFWNGQKINLINYKKVNEKEQDINQIFSSNKNFEVTKIKWILELSNDSFWQFYNSDDNPKYPEINKLKPSVKDSDGVLNIYKLAEIIEKNKSILKKYLNN